MSRFLSEALGIDSPKFSHALMAAERSSGHPNHDLRLSSSVLQSTRAKLDELGLDSQDTTAEELYHRLNDKLAADDRLLTKKLRALAAQKVSAEGSLVDGLVELVKDLKLADNCLAIKSSVLKSQLKVVPPRKVMKALGYRSVDSMVKLEPMPLLLLAINNFESEAYVVSFYSHYAKYSPSDLEIRGLSVLAPRDKKWLPILSDIKKRTGLGLVSSYELASVIVLPSTNQPKTGAATMLTAQLLSELTLILSVSSYLKTYQVRADFGDRLKQIAEHEPLVEVKFLNRPLPWQAAQQVLAESSSDIYGPHVSSDDLEPVKLLTKLADAIEDFKFWVDSDFLTLVRAGEATSLNIMDVATNLVNNLPFEMRRLEHGRRALMQELTKAYIRPEQIIESLTGEQVDDQKSLAVDKAQALY